MDMTPEAIDAEMARLAARVRENVYTALSIIIVLAILAVTFVAATNPPVV